MIRYFISYTTSSSHGLGFGTCEIHRAAPIRSIHDIPAIAKLLRDQGISEPIILSFSRFADPVEQRKTA